MKKDFLIKFNTITNILILFLVIAGGFVWADTNGIWLRAEDVRPGIFGADEMPGDFTFQSNVILQEDVKVLNNIEVEGSIFTEVVDTQKITLDGQEINSWPQCVSSEDCYWSNTYSLDNLYQCNPGFAMTGFVLKSESTFQIKCCKFGTTILE